MKSGAFPSMLRVDFRRVFSSFGFYATVLCTFLVFLLSASEEIQLVAGQKERRFTIFLTRLTHLIALRILC